MVRRWAWVAALAAWGAAAASAQEIFWDGFEQGDLCAWSNPPVTVTHETEAYNQSGSNDDASSAQVIGRCAIVEGTIGDPYDAQPGPGELITPDTDYYQINVQGPVLLHVRLERIGGSSDFQAFGEVFDSYSGFPDAGLTACDTLDGYPALTERQIYLPENGFVYLDPSEVGSKQIPGNNKWYIEIDDARNSFDPCFIGFSPVPVGGVDLTYRLTLSIDPVTGPSTIPLSQESVQFPGDGSLLIYRIDGATVANLDLAETFIDRTTPNLLDTKLYLVRKNGAALTTVAGDDDFDTVNFSFDSQLQGPFPLAANPYFVIVDDFAKLKNGPLDMQLTIQFLQALWR